MDCSGAWAGGKERVGCSIMTDWIRMWHDGVITAVAGVVQEENLGDCPFGGYEATATGGCGRRPTCRPQRLNVLRASSWMRSKHMASSARPQMR